MGLLALLTCNDESLLAKLGFLCSLRFGALVSGRKIPILVDFLDESGPPAETAAPPSKNSDFGRFPRLIAPPRGNCGRNGPAVLFAELIESHPYELSDS
jgi:hypothetical protein